MPEATLRFYSGCVVLSSVRPLSREFEEREGPELESSHSGLFAQAQKPAPAPRPLTSPIARFWLASLAVVGASGETAFLRP